MDTNGRRSFFVISLVAFALFLAVALLQYSPHDWPIKHNASFRDVANLAGPVGSLMAWFFSRAVGSVFAWLAPFFLLILAGALALDRTAHLARGVMRTLLIIFLLNTFFALLRHTSHSAQLSGWIGRAAASGLKAVFGQVGSTIIVTACLLIVSLNVIGFLRRKTSAGVKRGAIDPRALGSGFRALWAGCLAVLRALAAFLTILVKLPGRLARRRTADAEPVEETIVAIDSDYPRIRAPRDAGAESVPVSKPPKPKKPAAERAAAVSKPSVAAGHPAETASAGIPIEEATLPSLSLLDVRGGDGVAYPEDKLKAWAAVLEEKLAYYNIVGRVTAIKHGPLITTFEFAPNPGVKVKDIVSRADDITLAMKAKSLRLIAPIPGRSVVGIEIPNPEGAFVYLRDILPEIPERKRFSGVMVGIGVDVMGKPFYMNLCDAPHLLVAGTTGSGKSVTLHGILASILLQYRPEDVRLLIVDPKMVEMNIYNGLPHLLHPVTNDPKETVQVFQFLIEEMDRRKETLKESGVKNIESFNSKIGMVGGAAESTAKLPYIILVIDELGDLVLSKGVDMESLLSKLSNMARAVGIHMVVATQRPSVDVIVGKTKANFPTRIAFRVATKVDSRTIIDCVGAEKLLGRGDMLYMDGNNIEPIRLHGAFLSEIELERVIAHWKSYEYAPAQLEMAKEKSAGGWDDMEDDPLYDESMAIVLHYRQGSTSLLQRRLHIGYARAARLLDRLEQEGIVGPPDGSKPREVLVSEKSSHSLDD